MKSFTLGASLAALLVAMPLVAGLSTGQAQTEPATSTFVPFDEFIQNVRETSGAEVLARPTAQVKDLAAIEEMRQHILTMYKGVEVLHSFVLDSQTFDCIPIAQQPSVRIFGLTNIASEPPSPPPFSPFVEPSDSEPAQASQLPEGQTQDEFSNALGCEDQTIPMSRITIEQLSRFQTLQQFFEKGPNGAGHAHDPANVEPPATATHKYAYAQQSVDNLGPSTNLNVWRPHVYTDLNEVFSLAQLWTVGTSTNPVQTAETGWQNYPALYGTQNSVLFIYWTADGYNHTGCYNLTCPGFVQTSSTVYLGSGFTHYSTVGGAQYEYRLEYYLYQGNWWLWAGNTWAGYYPATIYGTGQLSKHSNLLQFGSESVGTTVWPKEGSGLFPRRGFRYAAYQRLLYHVDLSNTGVWDSLTPMSPSPTCYAAGTPGYQTVGGVYFYFGGPGGRGC